MSNTGSVEYPSLNESEMIQRMFEEANNRVDSFNREKPSYISTTPVQKGWQAPTSYPVPSQSWAEHEANHAEEKRISLLAAKGEPWSQPTAALSGNEAEESELFTASALDTFVYDHARLSKGQQRARQRATEWVASQAAAANFAGVEPGWAPDTVRSRDCAPWKLTSTILPHSGSAEPYLEMPELAWAGNLLSCLGVERNEGNLRAMVTLWITDAAGPAAAEGYQAETRPGSFPIPRHFSHLDKLVRGDSFWEMVDRLLDQAKAPADTFGNSLRNQVGLTILQTADFWELGPILSAAIDSFWFEQVRVSELGYDSDRVPPVVLPSLLRKDRRWVANLSHTWSPSAIWWKELQNDLLRQPTLTSQPAHAAAVAPEEPNSNPRASPALPRQLGRLPPQPGVVRPATTSHHRRESQGSSRPCVDRGPSKTCPPYLRPRSSPAKQLRGTGTGTLSPRSGRERGNRFAGAPEGIHRRDPERVPPAHDIRRGRTDSHRSASP